MANITQTILLNKNIAPDNLSGDVQRATVSLISDASIIASLAQEITQDNLEKIKNAADKIRRGFKSLVIIGTGASSAIPKIFFSLVPQKELEVHFLENPDQTTVDLLLDKLDPKSTCFLSISKSGQTIETIAILLCVMEWFEESLDIKKYSDNFYFIVNKTDNYLYKIARKLGSTIVAHPKSSGRYSFFGSLGLLPAALCGLNIKKIIEGAKSAAIELMKPNSWLLNGVEYVYTMHKIYPNYVFMSYGDKFQPINSWFQQLLAESLGKDGKGINPIISTGTVDQHSQLQLYLDGPNDKFFTILMNAPNNDKKNISTKYIEEIGIECLSNKSLEDIMSSQAQIVIDLLQKHNKNLRVLTLASINESSISELCMGLMLEVILLGQLMNINPFDQPAVEDIKQKALAS